MVKNGKTFLFKFILIIYLSRLLGFNNSSFFSSNLERNRNLGNVPNISNKSPNSTNSTEKENVVEAEAISSGVYLNKEERFLIYNGEKYFLEGEEGEVDYSKLGADYIIINIIIIASKYLLTLLLIYYSKH